MERSLLHQKSKLKLQLYKDLFNVPDDDILNRFETLLHLLPCALECSHKVSGELVFSRRLNLWFHPVARNLPDAYT